MTAFKFAFFAGLIGLITTAASANTIYTYTGATYTGCYNSYAPCTGKELTGYIDTTLTGAQTQNLYEFFNPYIASFSFSDGYGLTLDNTNSSPFFQIVTDGAGDITQWTIELGGVNSYIDIYSQGSYQTIVQSSVGAAYVAEGGAFQRTQVPEPSTLSLFGAALLSFAGVALYRRRKQSGADLAA